MSMGADPTLVARRDQCVIHRKEIVESIFWMIPDLIKFHDKNNKLYSLFDKIVRSYFSKYDGQILDIAPLDKMYWPRIMLGKVSSYDFFSLDEFIVFSFFWVNRDIYRTVFDLGANIGFHSIVLSRFGYEVHSFEPDTFHYDLLVKNLAINKSRNVHTYRKAVSERSGVADFVHVNGNTTASHILGSRDFHGDVEYIKVDTVALHDIGIDPDLIKFDIEGHEKNVLLSMSRDAWNTTDAIGDIHGEENSKAIFEHFHGSGINLFVQKQGWRKVETVEEMPTSYRDGPIFISRKSEMPWSVELG